MEVFLTCGLGDFVALESYLTQEERDSVEVIHWATRARNDLMKFVPFIFKNVKQHVVERDRWGEVAADDYSIASKRELQWVAEGVVDWSVGQIIDDVRKGERKFQGSSFSFTEFCGTAGIPLPPTYWVVHPYSMAARSSLRDLTDAEWSGVCGYLAKLGMPVVVVNKGNELLRSLPGVLDLTNKLSLFGAVEVVKRAAGFFGAASVFSVIASKSETCRDIFIKGSNDLRDNFSSFYYVPSSVIISEDMRDIWSSVR